MGLVQGGMIHVGSHTASSASTSLALSDGLACATSSFSGVTSTSITHNLNSNDLIVEFVDSVGNLLIPDNWSITNLNVIEATFSPAATGRATIIACVESGLNPIRAGVLILEGLSGIIDLDSPNGSIDITTSGQVVNLNAIFTPASGAVLQQKCADIITLSGLIGAGDVDAGQTSLNGISGVLSLISPDESVNINVNGQDIELTTPGSGAPSGASYILVDYNDNDHLTDARKLTATSGVILDDQGARSGSGIVIKLDFDDEPTVNQVLAWGGQKLEWVDQTGGSDAEQTSINDLSGVLTLISPDNSILIGQNGQAIELSGLFTPASGAVLQQKCEDIITVSGLAIAANSGLVSVEKIFTPTSGFVFVLEHGLQSEVFTWDMWRNDSDPILSLMPESVSPSGVNHAIIQLDVPVSGRAVFTAGRQAPGVTSVESLMGIIDIDSPDGSINIATSGQIINLTTATKALDLITVLGDYVASVNDTIILADATLGPITIDLPGVGPSPLGKVLHIKKIDSSTNSVLVNGGGATIDGTATKTITFQYDAMMITSDNSNWHIL